MLDLLKNKVKKLADPERAESNLRFYKTGSGQYSEGIKFLGLTNAQCRQVARQFNDLKYSHLQKLLKSPIHDERIVALRILTARFKKVESMERGKIYKFYLQNSKNINNWDLVDMSADKIVGQYLLDNPKDKSVLTKLAKSDNLWERRIAMITTYQFIKNDRIKETLQIARLLLKDNEDLIHKAVGWMLREVGKKDLAALEKFLQKHYKNIPRTTLRYAIERFPEPKRKKYLKGQF